MSSSVVEEFRSKLIGTWQIESVTATRPVKKGDSEDAIHPYTKNVKGFIMYTPDGYMSVNLMIPGAPKVESGDFRTATTEEAARLGRSALAYAGPFHVKEDAEKPGKVILSHSMTVCTFPNWLGNTQVRNSNLEGNVLELSPLNLIPTLGEDLLPVLRWIKAPINKE